MTTRYFVAAFLLIATLWAGYTAASPSAPIDVEIPDGNDNETDFMFLGVEEAKGNAWSDKNQPRRLSFVKGNMFPLKRRGGQANVQEIVKVMTSSTYGGNQTYMFLNLNGTEPCMLNNTTHKIVLDDVGGGLPEGTNANRTDMMLMGTEIGQGDTSTRFAKHIISAFIKGSMQTFRPRREQPKPEDILKIVASALGGNETYLAVHLNETQPYMLNNTMLEIKNTCKKGVRQ